MSAYGDIRRKVGKRHIVTVFIAGDYGEAQEALRNWCSQRGDCWAVERCEYIYTGGQEAGVRLTKIAYPRFHPEISAGDIQDEGEKMAEYMLAALHQNSCTVVGPVRSVFVSRYKEPF